MVVSSSDAGDQILHQSSAITHLDSGDGTFRKVKRPGETVAGFCALAEAETGLFRVSLPVAGPEWASPGGLFISGNHVVDMDVWAQSPSVVWRTRRINLQCTAERSSDAGMTWQPRGEWPDAIFAVHIHPKNPDRVMHSFGYLNNGAEALGVRTTTDGGETVRYSDDGGTTFHPAFRPRTQRGTGSPARSQVRGTTPPVI